VQGLTVTCPGHRLRNCCEGSLVREVRLFVSLFQSYGGSRFSMPIPKFCSCPQGTPAWFWDGIEY